MAKLRFGGPKLPPGRKTWYETPSASSRSGIEQVFAYPGDEVEAEKVCRWQGHDESGQPIFVPAADYYVEKGMAEYVNEEPSDG